jgi:hypothetical protein
LGQNALWSNLIEKSLFSSLKGSMLSQETWGSEDWDPISEDDEPARAVLPSGGGDNFIQYTGSVQGAIDKIIRDLEGSRGERILESGVPQPNNVTVTVTNDERGRGRSRGRPRGGYHGHNRRGATGDPNKSIVKTTGQVRGRIIYNTANRQREIVLPNPVREECQAESVGTGVDGEISLSDSETAPVKDWCRVCRQDLCLCVDVFE